MNSALHRIGFGSYSYFKGTRAQNFFLESTYLKYILDISLSKESNVECMTLKKIWYDIKKDDTCIKTEVTSFSVPWTRIFFSLILNGELENVLMCAQFSLKLAHGINSLCLIAQLFRCFWDSLYLFPFYAQAVL